MNWESLWSRLAGLALIVEGCEYDRLHAMFAYEEAFDRTGAPAARPLSRCSLQARRGGALDPHLLEPASRAWIVDSAPVQLVDYLEAGERLWAFGRRLLRGWDDDLVLLTPTLTRLPVPVGLLEAGAGVTDDAVRFSALTRIWNVTGQPAISLPFVPVGVQLVGAHGRDDLPLSVAGELEAAAGWRPR